MQYFSPFLVPGLSPDQQLTRSDIIAAKKRVLTEFELQHNQATIILNGWELGKSELIDLLESITDEKVLDYHRAIYHDKKLKAFLEEQELPEESGFAPNALYRDPGFLAFISPYFTEAYRQLLGDNLRQLDLHKLALINGIPFLCTPETQDRCFSSARSVLAGMISELEAAAKSTLYIETTVSRLTQSSTISAIAMLPSGVGQLRWQYFEAQIDLSLHLFNKLQKRFKAIDILHFIIRANISVEMNDRARHIINQMETIIKRSRNEISDSRQNQSSKSGGAQIFVILAIVFGVIRLLVTLNSSGPKVDTNYFNTYPKTIAAMKPISAAELGGRLYLGYISDSTSTANIQGQQVAESDSAPPLSGSHPYYQAADVFSMLYIITHNVDTLSKLPITFVNRTREDLVLIVDGGKDELTTTFYIRRDDSIQATLFNSLAGIKLWVSGGEGWNSHKYIPAFYSRYSNGEQSKEVKGGFSKPDYQNLGLLREPYALQADTGRNPDKETRLVISKTKKGLIKFMRETQAVKR